MQSRQQHVDGLCRNVAYHSAGIAEAQGRGVDPSQGPERLHHGRVAAGLHGEDGLPGCPGRHDQRILPSLQLIPRRQHCICVLHKETPSRPRSIPYRRSVNECT